MSNLNRREFFQVSALAGGGFMLGFVLESPVSQLLAQTQDSSSQAPLIPNAWLQIDPDGQMTFTLDKTEMGQGVYTSLPTILAEELEVEPEDFVIKMAVADRKKFGNPALGGLQMTGGSNSVAVSYPILRKAGATACIMLTEAAAEIWAVPTSQCLAKQGKIFHTPSQRSLNYGELAPHAAKLKVPQDPALKQNQDYRLIGRHRKRLDGPQKVTGRADFGIDIDIPNLRIAVLIQCPTFGGQLQNYDDSEARTVVGVEDITPIAGGIAIVAQKYYQSRKAADRMKINWNHGPNESLSSKEIYESLEQVADDRLQKMVNAREVRNVLRSSKQSLDLTYHVPFAAHVTMEPMNCTAHFSSEKCEVWAPTQSPGLAQQLVHELTGLPLSQIDIHATFLGGGFGRRLAQDYVVQAVAISMAVQKPIKLIWSREDDMQHDFYRPVTVHRIRVAIDAEQQPQFYGHTVAGPSIFSEALGDWVPAILPPWLPGIIKSSLAATISGFVRLTDKDPTALEGIKELVYTIPYQQTNFTRFDHGIPVGFWRSVGHSYSGFVVESVMDELAHFLDQDPYHYRRNLLKKSPRHLAVLEQLADKSSWLQSPPPGVHRGLAIHASFGSICGQVAEIMIDPSTKQLQVKRIVCVIDCGRTIDPSTVEAQISGGIIFALSATLYGEITIEGGQVQQSNFHDYPIMRYSECPQIEVSIMTSDEPPAGVGEPGVPPLAAAVANAVFAATGKRLRSLPLKLNG